MGTTPAWTQFNVDFGALNWMDSAKYNAANVDTLCTEMVNDVLSIVWSGKMIQFGRIDRLTRFLGSMWEGTKKTVSENPVQSVSYVVTGGVGFATGGLLGAPVALGLKYGGKKITDTAKDWWTGSSKSKEEAEQRILSNKNIEITKRVKIRFTTPNGQTRRKDLVMNDTYGQKVLTDVGTVIKLGGLEKLHTAFSALKQDFETLKCRGFCVAYPNGENKPPVVTFNTGTFKNCDDYARLWEQIFRVRKRLLEVSEAGTLLEDFVTYIAMGVSKSTSEADPLVGGLWNKIVKSKPVKSKVQRQIIKNEAAALLDYLGEQVKAGGFQKTYGTLTKGQKDYGVWAYAVLRHIIETRYPSSLDRKSQEYLSSFAFQLDLEAQKRVDPSGYARRAQQAWESLKSLGSQGVGVSQDLLGNYDPRNCDMYINALGSIVQDSVSPEGLQIPKTLLQGAADILGRGFDVLANFGEMKFTEAGTYSALTWDPSSVNIFQGTMMLAEPIAAAYLKSRTRRMVDPTNKTWSHTDKVLALRELAQESAEQYINVIEDFKKAADTIKQQPQTPSKAFEALLKYCLAQEVYYTSHTGQMLEDAGIAIARFRVQLHVFENKALAATNSFLSGHPAQPCSRTVCCYGSLLKALGGHPNSQNLLPKLSKHDKNLYAQAPCQRVNGKNDLEDVVKALT